MQGYGLSAKAINAVTKMEMMEREGGKAFSDLIFGW